MITNTNADCRTVGNKYDLYLSKFHKWSHNRKLEIACTYSTVQYSTYTFSYPPPPPPLSSTTCLNLINSSNSILSLGFGPVRI